MSAKKGVSKLFKSLIYSKHSVEDCTQVLSLHSYSPVLTPSSIILKTLAFPINPSDINQLQGVYPSTPEKTLDYQTGDVPSAIAGNEGVFEIVDIPASSTSKLKKGDWVIPLKANFGTWSTYRTCTDPDDLIKVNGLDLYTAATIGVNGCTAWQLIHNHISKWKNDNSEWIVTNAGTSQVAKLVTQIASFLKINTLSVIRDRDNFDQVADVLKKEYGATHVISESQNMDKTYNKETLPSIIGKNPDFRLALNSVGGKSSTAIARKLKKNGVMLTYGGMSKQPVILPTSLLIFKNIQCLGFWVTENGKQNPQSKVDAIEKLLPLYTEGIIKSPKNDLNILEWDISGGMTDGTALQLIKDGITKKGKKNLIVLKH
ncbi:probable Probable trans-2-enoyl-CoA reductase, mitochondrial [Saccharomycodes ludwigii]|uniref:Probable Probable trans-2-enoyl-CoA reductase, mitochondrial n=1 Tax=Saccharomycodes ludwigii TaxID=36035 RepID=A0A376B559_9ASCO|nr:hypothetical protein SCDLUD_002402 [Saccharomycodes ludwigii]KAH3900941.1 hypothetical protein SCDLUD_002402 [Saccharomycodes ludwigii]SSD59826.1 probable Probable trans-2-enoyl-CoA reductase, mitochondrial [Saccharomycodes ludwigii]